MHAEISKHCSSKQKKFWCRIITSVLIIFAYFWNLLAASREFLNLNKINNHEQFIGNDREPIISVVLQHTESKEGAADYYSRSSVVHPNSYGKIHDSTPDNGGLQITLLLPSDPFQRLIRSNDEERYYKEEHTKMLKRMDGSVDESTYHSEELNYPRKCYRPNWVDNRYPVCNTFHELAIDVTLTNNDPSWRLTFLNSGYFRDVWRMEFHFDAFPFVLKTVRPVRDMNRRTLLTKLSVEALTMERLSASTRIASIYGHCSFSVMGEYGHEMNLASMANATMREKLDLAITMAESVAELHGFEGGVITNDDIKLEQWLRSARDGRVMLNDFNNGSFMQWNRKENQYCPYNKKMANILSPEQLKRKKLTEKSDVYSLGIVLYSILTGLQVFQQYDRKERKKLVKEGMKPFIPPELRNESFLSSRMVEIIEQCWATEPKLRVDSFSVVSHLRKTREQVAKRNTLVIK